MAPVYPTLGLERQNAHDLLSFAKNHLRNIPVRTFHPCPHSQTVLAKVRSHLRVCTCLVIIKIILEVIVVEHPSSDQLQMFIWVCAMAGQGRPLQAYWRTKSSKIVVIHWLTRPLNAQHCSTFQKAKETSTESAVNDSTG